MLKSQQLQDLNAQQVLDNFRMLANQNKKSQHSRDYVELFSFARFVVQIRAVIILVLTIILLVLCSLDRSWIPWKETFEESSLYPPKLQL